jgi:hypothetical protein
MSNDLKRRAAREPLYDVDPRTGGAIEVFYADHVLAGMRGAGWFWWSCERGRVPEWPPVGPFTTAYRAYRDALAHSVNTDTARTRRFLRFDPSN